MTAGLTFCVPAPPASTFAAALLNAISYFSLGKEAKKGKALKYDQSYSTSTSFQISRGKDTKNSEAVKFHQPYSTPTSFHML